MLVQDYLIRSARAFPEKPAVVHNGRRAAYREVLGGALAAAAALAGAGIRKGETVAILNGDPVEYLKSYFGALLAGCTAAGLNTDTCARTLEQQVNHCSAAALLAGARHCALVREVAPALASVRVFAMGGAGAKDAGGGFMGLDFAGGAHGPDASRRQGPSDIAQIIFTSGTTGSPSAVMLRHSNLVANTESIIKYLGLRETDSVMAVLPFFYSYGNSIMLTHFAVGGTLVVNQNFLYPNTILGQMASEKVTGFSGVPSTFAILLGRSAVRRYSFPHLRYLTQAGGPMAPALAREVKSLFPEADLYIMYGQTEASARLSYLEPSEFLRKAGSVGKAIPGVRLDILREDGTEAAAGEVGEIVASGENIMAGYLGGEEKTAMALRDGRLWTGDLARKDEEGFIYIVSRKSELIKSGAHRIHPQEIESTLAEHPSVEEAAVAGVQDEILGQAIKAFVVGRKGAQCSKRELLAHCRSLLPSYKVPHQIEFVSELPRTVSGKIRRSALGGESAGAPRKGS